VVVLLLLLSPVLVELVDFDRSVALLKQVKSLQVAPGKNTLKTMKESNCINTERMRNWAPFSWCPSWS
jgi:hypothetical protein